MIVSGYELVPALWAGDVLRVVELGLLVGARGLELRTDEESSHVLLVKAGEQAPGFGRAFEDGLQPFLIS